MFLRPVRTLPRIFIADCEIVKLPDKLQRSLTYGCTEGKHKMEARKAVPSVQDDGWGVFLVFSDFGGDIQHCKAAGYCSIGTVCELRKLSVQSRWGGAPGNSAPSSSNLFQKQQTYTFTNRLSAIIGDCQQSVESCSFAEIIMMDQGVNSQVSLSVD